ncbi:hypothetical protein HDU80_002570 [Chytriomyces hyalinus]|nr:hypothetical protein HDU80_002570 [Chytriomyces hyalinus]
MELAVEIPLYVTNKKSVERAIELAFAESDDLRGTRFKLFKRKNETNGFLTVPNEQAGIFIIMAGKWGRILVGLTEIKPRKSGRRPDPNVIKSLLHSQPTHKTIAKKDGGGQKDIEQLLGEQLDYAWDDSDGASQSSYISNWSTNMPEAPEQDLLDETEVSLPVREIWFGVWVDNEATQHHLPVPQQRVTRHSTLLPASHNSGFNAFDLLTPQERGKPTFSPEWKASQIFGTNSFDHPYFEIDGHLFKLKLSAEMQIQFFEYDIKSVVLHHKTDECNVFITLAHPPIIADTSQTLSLSYADVKKATFSRLYQVNPKHSFCVFNCLVCRISFKPSIIDQVANIFSRISPSAQSPVVIAPSTSNVYARKHQELLKTMLTKLPIRVAYQLSILLTWNVMFPTQLVELAKKCVFPMLDTRSEQEVAQILNTLARSDPWEPFKGERRPNFCKRFETIVAKFQFVPDDFDKGKYNTTYRLYVTPTGMYIDGPFLETSNRVIRQYKEYSAHFLHVTFVDEDGAMFSRSNLSEIPHDIIYEERFCTMLKEGIRVAGRLFKFLAFSNSSLKEGRVLFFHEPNDGSGVTVESMRAWMGDFSKIKLPARYAARMGQAFTSTASTVKVLPSEVNMYFPDVERNNYNFSDGIGTVSEEIASEIWDMLKKQDKRLAAKLASGFSDIVDAVPSAFQIRFGGAKGMVSVDPSLPGRRMNIRQSMIKFETKTSSVIEVADYSSVARDAYFNRQIILILEDLGVPKQVFLELQRNAVRELASMWGDKAKLIELAGKDGAFGNYVRLWENMQLSEWLTNEFVRASFEHIRAYMLKEIKYRARFKIPGGWHMFGVLDETGTLKEGQVFVQIRSPQETKVLTGPHIIYRSPVIHPGDVQPVVAVDIPQLRHLHNVIVFSQHGKRDLPSQLGGGDLDGDMFSIIQNRTIFPKRSEFRVAADYAVTKPDAMDRPVTMDDISEFIIFFMVNDRVGMIARRHLALADQRDGGSTHPDCLVYSELHNQAVDFAKSGKPASLAHAPKPRGRPDFMYRPNDPIKEGFYKSSRAMGLMYRDEELNSMIDRTYSEGQKERMLSDADPLWRRMKTRAGDWESYVEDARKYQFTFENEMERIANYTRPKLTELELWTGYVLLENRKTFRELFNLEEWVREQFSVLLIKTEALMKKGKSEKEVLGQAVANYYISNIVKESEKFGCVFGLLLLHHIAEE